MHQAIVRREPATRRKTEIARTALAVLRLSGRAARARRQDGARAARRGEGRTRSRRRP